MTFREERIGDCRLILGDCLSVLPTLGPVDAVVTDPPYGIGAARGAHSNLRMTDKDWDDLPADISALPHAPTIIWGGNYFPLPPSRCFLFWDKHPMPPSYAAGELAWTNLDRNAAKWCGRVGDEVAVKDRSHPTQKPVGLMEWCIGFIPDAMTILDPYMGSGTTLVACAKLGRHGIGIEVDPDYFEIACRRVEEAYRQPDLFVAPPSAPKQETLDLPGGLAGGLKGGKSEKPMKTMRDGARGPHLTSMKQGASDGNETQRSEDLRTWKTSH